MTVVMKLDRQMKCHVSKQQNCKPVVNQIHMKVLLCPPGVSVALNQDYLSRLRSDRKGKEPVHHVP